MTIGRCSHAAGSPILPQDEELKLRLLFQAALAKQLPFQDPIRPLQESFHAKHVDVEVTRTRDQGRHLISPRSAREPNSPTCESL
jgi:hypothetical protein